MATEATAPLAAKICTICGLDCSAKPRSKDAQGRYVCKECLDRAQEAKAAAERAKAGVKPDGTPAPTPTTATAPGDNSFILDLQSKSIPAGKVPCPMCGSPIKEDAVVCISCGFNRERNQKLNVKVIKAKESKAKASSGAGLSSLAGILSPSLIGIVYIVALVGLAVWGQDNPVGAGFYMLTALAVLFVSWIFLVISAFHDGPKQGWGCFAWAPMLGINIFTLVSNGRIFFRWTITSVLLWLYSLYYAVTDCDNDYVKWLYPTSMGALIAGMFLFSQASWALH